MKHKGWWNSHSVLTSTPKSATNTDKHAGIDLQEWVKSIQWSVYTCHVHTVGISPRVVIAFKIFCTLKFWVIPYWSKPEWVPQYIASCWSWYSNPVQNLLDIYACIVTFICLFVCAIWWCCLAKYSLCYIGTSLKLQYSWNLSYNIHGTFKRRGGSCKTSSLMLTQRCFSIHLQLALVVLWRIIML